MKNVMRNKLVYIILTASILFTASVLLTTNLASAWINGVGSPSTDPNDPVIGTHDRILNSAINMLPVDLQSKINMTVADYGTEMPDYNNTMCNCTYGIRDQRYHQVYYHSDGSLQDNSSARRAQEEYNLAMESLKIGDKYNFSMHVGMMSHYMSDISNFAHTMGNGSDWGGEGMLIHGEYENYVASASNKFFSSTSVKFDGNYGNISAYNATLNSANDTTFDNKFGDGTYTNVWMYNMVNESINGSIDNSTNLTYANADPRLISRTKQSINYSVNLIADVLYTMVITPAPTPSPTPTPTPVNVSFDFVVSPAYVTINIGASATYTLTVSNKGDSEDTYRLAINEVPSNATVNLTNNSITVGSGNSSDVALTVSGSVTGTYTVNVTATSGANKSNVKDITTTTNVVVAAPAPTYNSGSGSSGGSSSSGGGGGGGGSAEPYSNILKYEIQEHEVYSTPVSFVYKTPELAIYEVMVTSVQTNLAALRIEVLRDTSKIVNVSAPGVVYKNINAWIDYKRIKNATIRFKVENSWIDNNGLSSSDIEMSKWDSVNKKWAEIPTKMISKDSTHTYFESQIDVLSGSYVIRGVKDENAELNLGESTTKNVQSNNVAQVEQTENNPVDTISKKAPGFGLILSIVSMLSIVYIYRRTRSK